MYVVESDNIGALILEYEKEMKSADDLCEVADPETTPYKSKYEARELLDKICQKLEATRTIASLEKKVTVIEQMDWRLAAARVRLGIISWECDEPHNAQTDLELASQFFCPSLVDSIHSLTCDEEDADSPKKTDVKSAEVVEVVPEFSVRSLMTVGAEKVVLETMKCLNMIGILWAGRGRVRRSFLFLLAAKKTYHHAQHNGDGTSIDHAVVKEIESAYTHTLFYLAQAYGHIGIAQKSSFYCRETLQRQLDQGLNDSRSAMDWAKNCAGMADYYMSKTYFKIASHSLSCAENVLRTKVLAIEPPDSKTFSDATEILADINRRWIRLDLSLLKKAYDREFQVVGDVEEYAMEWDQAEAADIEEELREFAVLTRVESVGPVDPAAAAAAAADAPKTVFGFVPGQPSVGASAGARVTAHQGDGEGESDGRGEGKEEKKTTGSSPQSSYQMRLFKGIDFTEPRYLTAGEIYTFDIARVLFVRAVARIEEAKKVFVFDGE